MGFYHSKNIARVCLFLSEASTRMHAFIFFHIIAMPDSLFSTRSAIKSMNITKLHHWTRGPGDRMPVSKLLHWLPVRFRMDFKVLLLVFKCLGPIYQADLLLPYQPSQTLRSSGVGLLAVPRVKTKIHVEAAFTYDGSYWWNSSQPGVDEKRHKTRLCNLAFNCFLLLSYFYHFLHLNVLTYS